MRATWGARPIFGPDLDLAVNRPDTKAGPFPTCIYQRPPGTPEQRRFFFIYMFTAFLSAAMFSYIHCIGPVRAEGRAISLGFLLLCFVPSRIYIQPRSWVHTEQQRRQRCHIGIHFCAFAPDFCHACGLTARQQAAGSSIKFGGLLRRLWLSIGTWDIVPIQKCPVSSSVFWLKVFWGTGAPRLSLNKNGQLTDDDRPRRSHMARKAQGRCGRTRGGANTMAFILY